MPECVCIIENKPLQSYISSTLKIEHSYIVLYFILLTNSHTESHMFVAQMTRTDVVPLSVYKKLLYNSSKMNNTFQNMCQTISIRTY